MSACSETADTQPKEAPVVPVAVAKVSGGSLSDTTQITGTVKPKKDVEVMPAVSGKITSLSVKKGESVKEGQVLAKLDTTDLELNLKQAEAAYSRAENNYERAKATQSRAANGKKRAEETYKQAQRATSMAEDGLRQAQAALKQAQANLEQAKNGRIDGIEAAQLNVQSAETQWEEAKQNLTRTQGLFDAGLISQQQLDQAINAEKQAHIAYLQAEASLNQSNRQDSVTVLQAAVEQAQVGVDQAKKTIEDAKGNESVALVGIEEAEVAIQEAAVSLKDASVGFEEARIGIQQAQGQIDDMIIKSPVSGQVLDVMAEEGEVVSPQGAFARVISTDVVHLEVLLTPEQMFNLEEGDKVEVFLPSLDQTLQGTVNYLSPAAETSGLFKSEILLPNDNGNIKPGMVGQLNMKEVLVANSYLVPTEAVIEKNDSSYIFVIDKNKAVQKKVEVVRAETDFTAIKGSIQKGEEVVVQGQNLLEDGIQTRIVKEEK
ncbi:MAG TPA: efflux RND transporter periplasmic adaptor subunit [Chondromyces sp.]|nr:efflux RND transporter periplasmic adaptor subunit [Chondromyces sp.]